MRLGPAALIAVAALAAAGAAAQPRRTIEPDTILRADGCRNPWLGYRRLHGCTFTGMALSPTADRVLTVRDDDRAQLWTRDGRLLASEQATAEWGFTPTGSALFVGDAAVALTGHAWLLVFDAATGRLRLKVRHDMIFPLLFQAVDEHHVLIDYGRTEPPWQRVAVVDIRDGRIVREVAMDRQTDLSVRRWAIGISGSWDSPQQAFIHLATPTLEAVPLERRCNPLGPQPLCAAYDEAARTVRLFDPLARSWSAHDLSAVAGEYRLTDWVQSGGRLFVILCNSSVTWDESTRRCRLIDVEAARLLYEVAARTLVASSAVAADGTPEIRIAEFPTGGGRTRFRRIRHDGRVSNLPRSERPTREASALPGDLMLIEDPQSRRRHALLVAPGGRVVARMKLWAGACSHLNRDTHSPPCQVSADGRTLALRRGDVELFRLPVVSRRNRSP